VGNQDKDRPFAMHHELIQQTQDIEGSLDFHVFGGANSRAPTPTVGRVVHVHHDMIWLNDAQFQGLKYVAQHYYIHKRPGHVDVPVVPVEEEGPTEEELINYIELPTFEKALPEHYALPHHGQSCVCAACNPFVAETFPPSSSSSSSAPVTAPVEVTAFDDTLNEMTVENAPSDSVEVVAKGRKNKRHFNEDN
jgi:hypothetical protein